jgi:hypothetical protein
MLRRLINLILVSVLALAAAGLALFGPKPFAPWLPDRLAGWVEDIVGPGGLLQQGAVGAGDTPADFLEDGPEGWVAQGPIAAGVGNAPAFVSAVMTGYAEAGASAVPAGITTIRPILGCLVTPPNDGTRVGHAVAVESGMSLPVLSYSDAHLAEGVEAFVARYRKSGATTAAEVPGIAYKAYDVAVTETSGPVYLVLVAGAGNWIWNINLAPGVQIERVVLVGGDQAGVANLDPVIPVEVLLNDGLEECGIVPAYALNPGHLMNQTPLVAGLSQAEFSARKAELAERVGAFDLWFRDRFGVAASETRAGFDRGVMSLIGPVPVAAAQMAVHVSIAGGTVRMTEDRYLEIRGQVAAADSFVERVNAIATRFAFGNLANLRQGVDF